MNEALARVTFAMEQHLGHRSYYENLRAAVDADERLSATWAEIDYHPEGWGTARLVPPRLRGPLGGRHQVLDALRSSRPDVAFFNTQVPAVLATPNLRRLPYVLATDITPRQYDRMAEHYDHPQDRLRAVAAAKDALNRRIFSRAELVVCWSTWCAESVRDEYGVPSSRVQVIAPGVDLSRWQPAGRDPSRTPVRLLFVGGDLDRKGGRQLIEAFRQLPVGSTELHLVTRSPYEPDGPGIVVHRGLTPNCPELIALYRDSDVFVMPSQAEAFGIAAAEASACGLPIIASRSGGLTDIAVDGVNGITLPSTDADVLAPAIAALVDDPGRRAEMGVASRRRAEEHFDAAVNGRRVADLLLDVAAAPSRA